MTSYLYLIGTACGTHAKVGITDAPEKRIRQLQTGSPFSLHFTDLIEFETRTQAADAERYFHRTLRGHATGGGTEWFAADAAQIVWDTVYGAQDTGMSRTEKTVRFLLVLTIATALWYAAGVFLSGFARVPY